LEKALKYEKSVYYRRPIWVQSYTAGKPLLVHTIVQAQKADVFDVIAVSSDSREYLDLATDHGVDYALMRPPELASDTAAKIPVIQHAVQTIENKVGYRFDNVTDLQVTSPLRLPEDIVKAIELFERAPTIQNLFSVTLAHSSPYFTLVERSAAGAIELSKTMVPAVSRRQDAPKSYDINGSIYVWGRDFLDIAKKVVNEHSEIMEMPDYRSLDIDNPLDFALAEYVAKFVDLRSGKLR